VVAQRDEKRDSGNGQDFACRARSAGEVEKHCARFCRRAWRQNGQAIRSLDEEKPLTLPSETLVDQTFECSSRGCERAVLRQDDYPRVVSVAGSFSGIEFR